MYDYIWIPYIEYLTNFKMVNYVLFIWYKVIAIRLLSIIAIMVGRYKGYEMLSFPLAIREKVTCVITLRD